MTHFLEKKDSIECIKSVFSIIFFKTRFFSLPIYQGLYCQFHQTLIQN